MTRVSIGCMVGGVQVGGGAPVVVQSMTNTDTADAQGTAQQVAELAEAGSEIVRITVNNRAAAAKVAEVRTRLRDDHGVDVPIVGDFHYNGHTLLREFSDAAAALDKYRINPGNVGRGARHDANFAAIVHTDIERDGALEGLNVEATTALARAIKTPVIASGGVTSHDDLRRLKAVESAGIVGVICGRALYDGRINAAEALSILKNPSPGGGRT